MELSNTQEIKKSTKGSKKSKTSKKPTEETVLEEKETQELSTKTVESEVTSLDDEEVKSLEGDEVKSLDGDETKSSDYGEENSVDSNEGQLSILLFNKQIDSIVETLNTINSKGLKDFSLNKEFVTGLCNSLKKITTQVAKLSNSATDIMYKEIVVSLKTKGSKSKKVKKPMDKDKCAINKKYETFPEVLKFMEFPEDSLVSRCDLLQKISSYVKEEKLAIAETPKFFTLTNKLGELFEFIKSQKIKRGDMTETDEFPTQISYTQIMGYLKYCIVPVKK